ncbi:hypothetical protein [Alkalicoccobacillus murimartini]|uniref:Uncharacterized protein n=1 Tax=Alkalicoccobacillus murimartini TaxID=171685 RepID=A0ABT9YM50_9BACI|nr:hypothetical protein [Alkalicoccobacillus murimartini]MDQ0208940.1 hypothetical protein [Alkalicoccobacillus murimartini]
MSNKKVPNGHDLSYRKGFAAGYEEDKRTNNESDRPSDLPNGHGLSYDKGYEAGKNAR